jgi:hypothetical protein
MARQCFVKILVYIKHIMKFRPAVPGCYLRKDGGTDGMGLHNSRSVEMRMRLNL